MELYNDDCFNVFPKIKDKTIDLFVLDLPYANKDFGKCTSCKWDNTIDLDKMWIEIKRIMKPNAVILFYCNTKFGFSLIKSNIKWFRYDLIWKKSRKVGFLSANKMPLRQHENIYVFKDKGGTYNPQKTEGHKERIRSHNKNADVNNVYGNDVKTLPKDTDTTRHPTSIIEHENVYVFSDADEDLENKKNKELRSYAEKVKKYIGKSLKIIDKKIGNQGIHRFYSFTSTQFGIPIEKNYNKLIEIYKINEMKGFIDYKTLKSKWDNEMVNTYNPQKTKGTPYNRKEHNLNNEDVYNQKKVMTTINKGDRHPTSIYPDIIDNTILEHNNPAKSLHRTQKPVSLCEWLIKTYSNEGDTIMDFTMGSGTTGEACKNTNRNFIGVEMDKDIFEIAKERLSFL